MDKNLRKAFLIGLGISLLTKEKIEQDVRRFMRAHKITEAESRKLAEQILSQGERHARDLSQKIVETEEELLRRIRKQAPPQKRKSSAKARRKK
ncbi:MAG: hypothetical protein V1743_05470 [Nanoarchaeota archaeon]